jgi:arylsulfatase A-like enzyme/tetratricopeptide (TPR) repeat protein
VTLARRLAVGAAVLGAVVIVVRYRGHLTVAGLLRPAPPNLLLISIDTLRADHLGCYGDRQADTPRLDALASQGLRFTDAVTVAPLTLPAHSSLMTGRFPAHHGVRDNGGYYLGDDEVTLAEVLRSRGYRTGGFVSAFVLDSRWGIGQGFDRYFDDFDLSKYEGKGMDAVQRRGDETVAKALAWLAQDGQRPFFAWVHLYDPHAPYAAPVEYATRFPATAAGAYDAEIAWTDTLVGRLLEGLSAARRLDHTVVVVVGDHGESLGEHREPTHGFFIYDATIHVPLIVVGPHVPVRTVAEQVRIVDVMPTVLGVLGASPPSGVDGRDLLATAHGEASPEVPPALSETWYPRFHYGWSELVAIRDGRFKLIRAPRPELYDLKEDPGEIDDLAARNPDRVTTMLRALTEFQARVGGAGPARAPRAVDPEVEERLAALGYTASGPSARALEDRPRGDPKDKIDLYNLLKDAGGDSAEGRLDDAIAKVREALARDPEIIEGHTLLGNIHLKAKRYDEAVKAYRAALALDPAYESAVFSLAETYKQMGRLEDAEAGFEKMRRLDPHATKPLWQLADIWMQRGQFDRAEGALKEALGRKVDRPTFLLKLGECYIEMKRYADAESALTEALAGKADLPSAHFDLGLVREARGQTKEAMAEYEAELARSPEAFRASFNLGKLLLQGGRPEEAARRFRATVEANPDFGTGYLFLAKALLDAGNLGEVEAAARKGLASHPEPDMAPLGHYVLADLLTREGRTGEAAQEVSAARRLAAKAK